MATTNRFEQVDEPAEDAMTLTLRQDGEKNFGIVTCPAALTGGRLPKGFMSDELPLKDSIRSAVNLANEMKVPLVVSDPDGLWQAEWGTLYRWDDEEEAGAAASGDAEPSGLVGPSGPTGSSDPAGSSDPTGQ